MSQPDERRKDVDLHRLSADELFVETIQDLQQRSRLNARIYDLLHVPILIRRLLLDDRPLVHIVNRERRLPLLFTVVPLRAAIPIRGLGTGWTSREFLDPDAAIAASYGGQPDKSARMQARGYVAEATRELTLDEFLAFPLVKAGEMTASVHDVVRHAAYTTGALHRENPEPDTLLMRLPEYAPHADAHLNLIEEMLVGIGRVVARALLPLFMAVDGRYSWPPRHGDLWLETRTEPRMGAPEEGSEDDASGPG